jgi:hypothetical protein
MAERIIPLASLLDFGNLRPVMPKTRYKTLQEYMEKTGTNQVRLLHLVKEQTGRSISAGMLSLILRGSRRCSRWNAFALHIVTGVPMDELTRWPRYTDSGNSRSGAGASHV